MVKQAVRVLYIHQDGLLTGSAISLRNLLAYVDKNHYQPRVVLAAEGPARQLYEELDIPVDVVPMRPYWTSPGPQWWESQYYSNLRALLPNPPIDKYLQDLRPDLVHINDKAMISAGLSARRVGLPVIWHLRSTYCVTKSRLLKHISRFLISQISSNLIAISEDEVDGFENFSNIRIVYNSIDPNIVDDAIQQRDSTRDELNIRDDEIVISMVDQLTEIKGAWDFIKSSGLAARQCPGTNFRFIIVARIPERVSQRKDLWQRIGLREITPHPEDYAWRLAHQAGIADNLILTGYRDDVLAIMAASDIVVVCKRLGVMGRQPIEAQAVGRPMIATAGHSGRSKVVVDGETALVVPAGDLQALAQAMINLAQDPACRQSMGLKGAKYARLHFNPYQNAQAVQQVYEEALTQHF